jgi:hypothetical protein
MLSTHATLVEAPSCGPRHLIGPLRREDVRSSLLEGGTIEPSTSPLSGVRRGVAMVHQWEPGRANGSKTSSRPPCHQLPDANPQVPTTRRVRRVQEAELGPVGKEDWTHDVDSSMVSFAPTRRGQAFVAPTLLLDEFVSDQSAINARALREGSTPRNSSVSSSVRGPNRDAAGADRRSPLRPRR